MFDETQVQSYKRITAPTELKQRVITACENSEPKQSIHWQKALWGLAPIAACLLLLFSVYSMNGKSPLTLHIDNTPLDAYGMELPNTAVSTAKLRSVSLEPAQYTVTLSTDRDVVIVSADGTASLSEDSSIIWTVEVPTQDMTFELFLQAEDGTYYVPLQYTVNDGSFSIRCEKE